MKIQFVKLAKQWFCVLPDYCNGSVADLEMVEGADDFLEVLSKGNPIVTVEVYTEKPQKNDHHAGLLSSDNCGGTYHVNGDDFNGEIWICNVTLEVLGDFPKHLYITNLTNQLT